MCSLTVDDGLHDEAHQLDTPIICNADCFHALLVNLSRPDLDHGVRTAQCRVLHDVSLSFMYSELCRNILVDSTSHRELPRLLVLHLVQKDSTARGHPYKLYINIHSSCTACSSFFTEQLACRHVLFVASSSRFYCARQHYML